MQHPYTLKGSSLKCGSTSQCIRSGISKKVDHIEMAVITPHYSLLLFWPHVPFSMKVKIIKKERVKKQNGGIQSTVLLCTFGS